MPKMKTHKGAQARIGTTGRGKLMRRKVGANNFRRKKHNRSKGLFDEMIEVSPTVRKRLRRLLPYGR
jgi:large subunit ribosomal protein L35